jgi:lambda family phage tail tape measure protein
MAETQIRRIEVKIDAKGAQQLKNISRGFTDLNKNIKSSTSAIQGFRNVFLAIQGLSFAGLGIREIVQAADAMQKLGTRLEITENSAIGAVARLKQLTAVANANFTSIEDAGVIYNRLSQALNDVGVSSSDVITLTDRLQKTFRVSGATTAEATAATIQLSQGLASGQIRGQELRSVLEANVVIGKLLAKQLGVTRGELLKFAEKRGGISAADFLQAVANNAAELDAQAQKLRPTIQEALIKNFNELRLRLNDLNKEFGLTEKVIAGLNVVFKNLDLIALGVGIGAVVKIAVALKGAFLGIAAVVSPFIPVVISLTGAFVNTVAAIGSVVAGFLSLPLVITGAVTSFVLAFSTVTDFRNAVIETTKSIAEFIKLSFRTPEYQKQYKEQKEAAERLAKAQEELSKSGKNYVLVQSDIEKSFIETINAMEKGITVLGPLEKFGLATANAFGKIGKEVFDFQKSLALLNEEFDKGLPIDQYNKKLKELKIKELIKDKKDGKIAIEEFNRRLDEINFGKLKTNLKSFQFDLRALNKEFGRSGDIAGYARELDKVEIKRLKRDFEDGRISLIQLNTQINNSKIEEINRQFAEGKKDISSWRNEVSQVRFEELNNQFKAGKIAASEFYEELNKIEGKFSFRGAFLSGVNQYVESAGTLATNVSNVVTQTFNRLEDSLVKFTETGKFVFRDFAKAVIEDINRIIIRALIIRPLAEGIIGFASPTTDAAGGRTSQSGDYLAGRTGGFAKGGAFNASGVQAFASGGVVNSPTLFGYGAGKTGLMGESGPEAILPLKRDNQGNLGVKATPSNVTVNVINQSGAETEQRESVDSEGNRIIDILIINKVREGFANGAFDRQLGNQYGLRRRGV